MKALETFFDGYRFRSRLEARWAVFFHTLQIAYSYESEGYDLDGTWYLPDFWLPEQNCYIEVKPHRELTEGEYEKASKLALQSGRDVYILAGDAWQRPPDYQIWRWVPLRIRSFPQAKSLEQNASTFITPHPEVAVVLQQLLDNHITLSIKYGYVTLQMQHSCPIDEFGIPSYIRSLEQRTSTLSELAPFLESYRDDLLLMLIPETGWRREVYGQMISSGFAWAECSACAKIVLSVNCDEVDDEEACLHQECQHPQMGKCNTASSRLIKAYEAARQERFST